ncbi:tetratricopeptide repeat protein [Carboxydochorda subterranea]|uniref:Tetratricopeptide repeat protein n=1 Tax=Carboxydichorda subterranea TaxID=3109565 RepID=A0ABZ1BUE4_9FIRM|nr:tetratricopeptide repeat protein [Limnochorda sp. L945t]WRP16422.1 tetratricopeptide repeat protein [Limnochorda sp. L945t]
MRANRAEGSVLGVLLRAVVMIAALVVSAGAGRAAPAQTPARPVGPGTLALRMADAMSWPDRFVMQVSVESTGGSGGAQSRSATTFELTGFPPDVFSWRPADDGHSRGLASGTAWRNLVQLDVQGPGPKVAYDYQGFPFLEALRLFFAVFRPLPEGSRLELSGELKTVGRPAMRATLVEGSTGRRAELVVDLETGLILQASALSPGQSPQTIVKAVRFDTGAARSAVEYEAPALGPGGKLVLVRLPSGRWWIGEAVVVSERSSSPASRASHRVRFSSARLGTEAGSVVRPDTSTLERIGALTEEGRALAAAGRYEEALARFRELVRIDPYNIDAHNRLGNAAMETGDWLTAASEFDQVIQLSPDSPIGYNNLAYAYAEFQVNLPEALKLAQRALELSGEHPDASVLDTYGWVLFQMRRLDEARQQLERAVAASGEDPQAQAEILYHLGMVHLQMQRVDEARRLFGQALALRPDFAKAREALARIGQEGPPAGQP